MRRFVRRLGLLLLWTAYCALLLEGGARAVFAWKAGPSALVYGTPLVRAEMRREMRWDEMIAVRDKGTAELASEIGSYSKYHPGQYQTLSVEAPDKPATLLAPAGVGSYPATANNHGFRGPDVEDAKAPGVALALGLRAQVGLREGLELVFPVASDHFLQHVAGIADECKQRDVLFIVASQLAKIWSSTSSGG